MEKCLGTYKSWCWCWWKTGYWFI